MLGKLLMAFVNVANPALGLTIGFFGDIVDFITTNEPLPGKRVMLGLASSFIPGGFLKEFAVDVAFDVLSSHQTNVAVDTIVNFNNSISSCEICHTSTHYYIHEDSRIICSECLQNDLRNKATSYEEIHLFRNNINQIQCQILKVNNLYSIELRNIMLNSEDL